MVKIEYIPTKMSWRRLKKEIKENRRYHLDKEALYLELQARKAHNQAMQEYKYLEVWHDAILYSHY